MKKKFNTLVFALVACYCLSLFPMIFIGCENSSGGGSLPPADTVSSNIGAAGGEVGDDNAMISIPAGALDSETTITVKYISNKKDVSDGPMLGFVGVGGNNKPLLSFSIDPDVLKEKQESEVAMVKDDFDFVFGSEFKIDGDITSIKTTQTITVEKKE